VQDIIKQVNRDELTEIDQLNGNSLLEPVSVSRPGK
jgi:hypothetical protein